MESNKGSFRSSSDWFGFSSGNLTPKQGQVYPGEASTNWLHLLAGWTRLDHFCWFLLIFWDEMNKTTAAESLYLKTFTKVVVFNDFFNIHPLGEKLIQFSLAHADFSGRNQPPTAGSIEVGHPTDPSKWRAGVAVWKDQADLGHVLQKARKPCQGL